MNLKKFERTLKERQSDWDIQYTKIETISKKLIITVSYIGDPPNWFARNIKWLAKRYFKRRVDDLINVAKEITPALRPRPLTIGVRVV